MLAKIKDDELIMFQMLSHPIFSAEILIHDIGTPSLWSKTDFGQIRKYQYPMLSYNSLFLYDPKKTKEENKIIENALAENYNLGGRLTGKSRISIIIDVINNIFKKLFKWAVISSYDKLHVQEIFETLITTFESHKILKLLRCKTVRSPIYKLTFDNGCLLESVNMNVTGKNPGGQFVQKHFDLHYMEEASYLTKEVSNKLFMSKSEEGVKNRYSGMTNFTKASPIGSLFFDITNKNKIINLPSYVNPSWTDDDEKKAVKEFGGIDSPGYQVEIDGKVIQGIQSVFDIIRIRDTYLLDKNGEGIDIKTFEVNKDTFFRYKEFLLIERPNNAEQLGIYFDVGEGGAPSEYIIIIKIKNLYKYIYRITTFQLTPTEEEEFIDYLIEKLSPTSIGLDYTSGIGKGLLSHLIKKYPDNKNNFIPVAFNENIEIGFKKDRSGNFITDKNNKYVLENANMVDWSIQCLKDIFYNKKIKCYKDNKFDTQMNNIIAERNKQGKILYACKGENHLFQAWQVFAICHWVTETKLLKQIKKKKPGFGTFGSNK